MQDNMIEESMRRVRDAEAAASKAMHDIGHAFADMLPYCTSTAERELIKHQAMMCARMADMYHEGAAKTIKVLEQMQALRAAAP